MPTLARDLRYGRRGGGWIDGDGAPAVSVPCEVCGRPCFFGARHRECALPVDGDQLELDLG